MNKKLSKIIKVGLASLGGLVVFLLAVIAILVNFVFTPQKLTPMVTQAANQSMNAQLDMKKVELTFFSSFPRFGLRLEEGSLVSKALRDTCFLPVDSLVSFKQCELVISPFDFLVRDRLTINYLGLENALVYAHKDKGGKANWDIMLADEAETDSISANTESAPLVDELAVDKICLKQSSVIFDDRDTRVYARMEDADLTLKAHLKKNHSRLSLDFANKNILFWKDGELLVNHLRTAAKTDLDLNRETHAFSLKDTRLSINGIDLDVDGTISQGSEPNTADVGLTYRLHTPSLETVLNLIPESIVKRGSVKADGEVLVEGAVTGIYGNGNTPQATLNVFIKEASAAYEGMPYGIDKIDLDFKGYIDLMKKTSSFADLKIFRFEGAHTHVLADARIGNLLGDPDIRLNVQSDIDLTSLAKTFPLQPGVALEGGIDTDLSMRCRLSSIQKQDFGRIFLKGKVDMKRMALIDSTKNFEFKGNARLDFKGKETLDAKLDINELMLHSSKLSSAVEKMEATVHSTNPKDSTRIVDLDCQFTVSKLRGSMGDSLAVAGNRAQAKLSLQPAKENPLQPVCNLSLQIDSLSGRMNGNVLGMDKGGFALELTKKNDSIWNPRGIIGFDHLAGRTELMTLPFCLHKTSVTINDEVILLQNAKMTLGSSSLVATGGIYNLFHSLKHHQVVKAKMEILSDNLDCNELVKALDEAEETVAVTDTLSEESPMELFVIPANVDFELQTDLKKVSYGKMVFEDVHGAVDVRNQAIHLKDLQMKGLDADMNATLVYQSKNKDEGYTGFDFKLNQVNIGRLVEFIPALDSIVPMLRSFKGIVNFEAAAEARLDSAMNIKIPSLRSAVHIKGDSLVLMDGETFAEISKMMMFKNKKRNLIDSIYVNMTIEDGNVTIYPFIVQMDRYRAAVGGTQGLDMNFNYHISVLKSPVPFKLGVNITGNLDKMKFRVGKAKYKDMVTPVEIRKVDSTRVNLGQSIVHDFEKIIRKPMSTGEYR